MYFGQKPFHATEKESVIHAYLSFEEFNILDVITVLKLFLPKLNMFEYSNDNLILNITPDKQEKTSELSKNWSPDSTP